MTFLPDLKNLQAWKCYHVPRKTVPVLHHFTIRTFFLMFNLKIPCCKFNPLFLVPSLEDTEKSLHSSSLALTFYILEDFHNSTLFSVLYTNQTRILQYFFVAHLSALFPADHSTSSKALLVLSTVERLIHVMCL